VTSKLGDLKNRVDDLKSWLGWEPSLKLKAILPLIDLARRLRNRIAHWNGQIGSDVAEFSASREVKDAFDSFTKNYCKAPPPPLPTFIRGDTLSLSPANVIFFGAIFYEVAREINDYVCGRLEKHEFVQMAFYYSCLVDTHPSRTIRHKGAESRIKHFLSQDYRFQLEDSDGPISSFLASRVPGSSNGKEPETSLWKVAMERHEALALQERQKLPQ
jgi:hypothetical protein